MLRLPFAVLLAASVVIAVFSPALNGELIVIDDMQIIGGFRSLQSWTFESVFFPKDKGALYYRPLMFFSFLFDKEITGLDPWFLHLHNIVLHAVNTILLFLIIRRFVVPDETAHSAVISLCAALFFGIHPIVSESVCWISGRTDIFSATFVLLSLYAVLQYRRSASMRWLMFSCGFLFAAILVKEVALAFAVGVVLFALASPAHAGLHGTQEDAKNERLRRALIVTSILFCVVFLTTLVLMIRSSAFSSQHGNLGMTIRYILNDPMYQLTLFLRALGFYVKKLFMPYPLSFAIGEIDPLYDFAGAAVVAICIYFFLRQSFARLFFLSGVALIVPALLLTLGQIAWTPYAERYLYIPSALIVLSLAAGAIAYKLHLSVWARLLCIPLLILCAFVSYSRATVWQTNYALLKDSVMQNEGSRTLLTVYAGQLLARGELAEARNYALKARSIFYFGVDHTPDLILGMISAAEGNVDDAIDIFEKILKNSKARPDAAVLENLADAWGAKSVKAINNSDRLFAMKHRLQYLVLLAERTENPDHYYESGKLALSLRHCSIAKDSFANAYKRYSESSQYRHFSAKLLNRANLCTE